MTVWVGSRFWCSFIIIYVSHHNFIKPYYAIIVLVPARQRYQVFCRLSFQLLRILSTQTKFRVALKESIGPMAAIEQQFFQAGVTRFKYIITLPLKLLDYYTRSKRVTAMQPYQKALLLIWSKQQVISWQSRLYRESIDTILNAVIFSTEMARSSSNRRKLIGYIGSKGLLDPSLIFIRIRSHGCR